MRYDLVPEKIQQLLKKDIEISEDFKKIIIPEYFNYEDSLEGECVSLAMQLFRALHTTNYLKELNSVLKMNGKPSLQPYLVRGQSRTHFIDSRSTHFWVGLLAHGEESQNLLTVDGSFQEISCTYENGYSVGNIDRNPFDQERGTSAIMPVGKLENKSLSDKSMLTLGYSADTKLIYGLSFVRDTDLDTIFPVVYGVEEDGKVYACVVRGKHQWRWDLPADLHKRNEILDLAGMLVNLSYKMK